MLNPLNELLAEPRLERIARYNADQDRLVALTVQRVVDGKRLGLKDPRGLELVLNEVCFLEEQRFRNQRGLDDEDRALKGRPRNLRRRIRPPPAPNLLEPTPELAPTT